MIEDHQVYHIILEHKPATETSSTSPARRLLMHSPLLPRRSRHVPLSLPRHTFQTADPVKRYLDGDNQYSQTPQTLPSLGILERTAKTSEHGIDPLQEPPWLQQSSSMGETSASSQQRQDIATPSPSPSDATPMAHSPPASRRAKSATMDQRSHRSPNKRLTLPQQPNPIPCIPTHKPSPANQTARSLSPLKQTAARIGAQGVQRAHLRGNTSHTVGTSDAISTKH